MEQEFDAFLDDISRCFTDRDVDLWLSRIDLPFSIIAKTGTVTMETPAAVEANFGLYLNAMDIMNVDLVHRRAVSLEDCKDGTWLGTFRTKLLSKALLATAPYTATALLKREQDRFVMTSMLNGRGHSDWTGVYDV